MNIKNLIIITSFVVAFYLVTPFILNSNHSVDNNSPTTSNVKKGYNTNSKWPYIGTKQSNSIDQKDLMNKNYYVILDGSGSMEDTSCLGNEQKMKIAKNAMKAFALSIPGNANVGLFVFDKYGEREIISLQELNIGTFNAAVDNIRASGGTPLKTAISTGYQRLTDQAKSQLGYGEYHLVVVTDGQASSGEAPNEIVNTVLWESPIVLHTIGFCIDGNHALNQQGRTIYRSAGNYDELKTGLQSVLAESENFQIQSFE